MKTIVLTLSLFLTSLIGLAQEQPGIKIEVNIDNITSDEGKVMVSLHTGDTFMKGPGIKNLQSSIENGKVSFVFESNPRYLCHHGLT